MGSGFDSIELPQWVVLSAVRYALDRHSYIVGLTTELVQRVWHRLDNGQQDLIQRDILGHIEEQKKLGLKAEKEWVDLATWISEYFRVQAMEAKEGHY